MNVGAATIILIQCIVGSCAFLGPPAFYKEAKFVGSADDKKRRFLMGQHHNMLKPQSQRINQEIETIPPEENLFISKARGVIRSNLGVDDPSVLSDDNFVWINPFVNEPVGKEDYVAAGKFFDLRLAFPDLDYRSYDFRVDPDDSFTIRCTCRVIGTFQEGLRLKGEVLSPNGKIMVCPPEGISMTFDPVTQKVARLCTGFCLDRQVGNTGGCTGIQGASVVAGKPMTILSEVNAHRPKRLENPSRGVRSPFPTTVMVQLARGVLSSNLGADDPSLLSDEEFFYVTPVIGPIEKKAYLRHYAEQELEGYDLNFSSLRVDPYEPERVWADARPTAPGFQGPPQVLSFSFDLNGRCNRITTSAVLDPSIGNAGGLGGSEGFDFALRNRKRGAVDSISVSISKQTEPSISYEDDIDEKEDEANTILPEESMRMLNDPVQVKDPVRPIIPPPIDKMTIVGQEVQPSGDDSGEMRSAKKLFESIANAPTTATSFLDSFEATKKEEKIGNISQNLKDQAPKTTTSSSEKESTPLSLSSFADSIRLPDFGINSSSGNDSVVNRSVLKRLEGLKDVTNSIRIVPEHISRSFSLLIDTNTAKEKKEAEKRRQVATSKRTAKLKSTVGKKKQTPTTTRDAKLELAKKVQALRRERMDREDLLDRARERREQDRLKKIKGEDDAGHSFNLFGSVHRAKVPSLSKWRQNADGTITGLISGSANYNNYEKVTTSPVKRGKIASKETVQTGSGTLYYLE